MEWSHYFGHQQSPVECLIYGADGLGSTQSVSCAFISDGYLTCAVITPEQFFVVSRSQKSVGRVGIRTVIGEP